MHTSSYRFLGQPGQLYLEKTCIAKQQCMVATDLILRSDALQEINVVISVKSLHVIRRAETRPEYLRR